MKASWHIRSYHDQIYSQWPVSWYVVVHTIVFSINSYKTVKSIIISASVLLEERGSSRLADGVHWVGYYLNLLTCTSFIIHKRAVNLPRVERPSSRPLPKSTLLSETSQSTPHQVESALWSGCCDSGRWVLHDSLWNKNHKLLRDNNEDCAYEKMLHPSVRVLNSRMNN